MGKKLVIAEKPSLGRSIASALSWWKNEKFERKGKGKTTWMEGNEYVIALSVGHTGIFTSKESLNFLA